MANYGIGGLYVTHTDHHMDEVPRGPHALWEARIGDRLATWMVYLSDVPAGGATVFPRAGVTVWPERGSVAFWWNLNAAGRGDDDTRHAACPVLHGSKWGEPSAAARRGRAARAAAGGWVTVFQLKPAGAGRCHTHRTV